VKTASVRQVRQGFYTTSAEKWRRYEAHLGPLDEVLAHGFEPVEPAPQAAAPETGNAARFRTAAATSHG
jgi:hypothetical protein